MLAETVFSLDRLYGVFSLIMLSKSFLIQATFGKINQLPPPPITICLP